MAYSSPWLSGKATGIVQVQTTDGQGNLVWVSLIDPSAMEYQAYDLDAGGSTGRGLDGKLLRDRVAKKEKLVMEFPPMRAEDMTTMLNLVAGEFFQCKYYSILYGQVREATMYVGDRSAKAYYLYDSANHATQMWTDIKFNFIEE